MADAVEEAAAAAAEPEVPPDTPVGAEEAAGTQVPESARAYS